MKKEFVMPELNIYTICTENITNNLTDEVSGGFTD